MQIADVNRTLFSVRRMKEAGNIVAFGLSENLAIVDMNDGKVVCHGGEDIVVNKQSGIATSIRDTGKDYMLDVWVPRSTF